MDPANSKLKLGKTRNKMSSRPESQVIRENDHNKDYLDSVIVDE
jgi:hypothetical protein